MSISIADVLRRHNYVKNILFLADRTALVKQAKNSYTNLLKDLSCCNLLDSKDDPESSRMIFSTYPTMLNAIDEKKNTYGIFDLERGVPTFAYELEKAVEEGYLVNYSTLEYKTKIMEKGLKIKGGDFI